MLKHEFHLKRIVVLNESGSRDWWKNMTKIMGLNMNAISVMQGLANKTNNGDCGSLANNIMNDFFVSVSAHLPRIDKDHHVFTVYIYSEPPGAVCMEHQ